VTDKQHPQVENTHKAHLTCAQCGYDLHALERDTCPECGTPVEASRLYHARMPKPKRIFRRVAYGWVAFVGFFFVWSIALNVWFPFFAHPDTDFLATPALFVGLLVHVIFGWLVTFGLLGWAIQYELRLVAVFVLLALLAQFATMYFCFRFIMLTF